MAKVYDTATDLITFARSSSGTALRRVGYGNELVTNGDFATGDLTGWTVIGSDATHSVTYSSGGARYQSDTTSPVLNFQQGGILEIGKMYQITVETTAYTSGSLKTDSFSGTKILSEGLGTITINAVASSTGLAIVRNSTNVDITIDNISVKEVIFDRATDPLVLFNHPDDIPRIEYGSDGSLKGLLIEEQRTNLVTYSEDFENSAWVKSGTVAIDSTLVTGPDGTLSGRRVLNFDDAAGDRLRNPTTIANATLTGSIWVKGEGSNIGKDVRLTLRRIGGASAISNVTHTLTADWHRLDATITQQPDNTGANLLLANPANGNEASEVLIYGAQLEEGSFPTSYIPTSGSTATRSADVASIPVSAFGYNQTAGTVVVEVEPYVVGDGEYYLSLNDGTTDERAEIIYSTSVFATMVSNGVLTSSINLGDTTGVIKVASALKENDAAACLNGGPIGTDTSTLMPVGVTTLTIGDRAVSANNKLNGHIKSIQYYPRRLTNAQLQELTS